MRMRVAVPLVLWCGLVLATPESGSRGGPEASADRGWTELISSMDKMHHAMSSVSPSRDTDEDFVRLMIPHHQAAIDMARTELLLGKNPQLHRLAQEIITDQQSEIDLMELWLKKHGAERAGRGGER